jgi:anti-anti-sigma regulatory factor
MEVLATVNIEESRHSGILILQISGKLGLGEPCASLRERFQHLLDFGDRRFVIDLRKTTKLDSAGIAELCNCWKSVGEVGGSIKLVLYKAGHAPSESCVTSAVFDPLADQVEWYSSVDEAVRSIEAQAT